MKEGELIESFKKKRDEQISHENYLNIIGMQRSFDNGDKVYFIDDNTETNRGKRKKIYEEDLGLLGMKANAILETEYKQRRSYEIDPRKGSVVDFPKK